MNERDKAREAAYTVEVERRFRSQVPDGEPLSDFRDAELPFKTVFVSGFDAGYASRDGEVAELRQALQLIYNKTGVTDSGYSHQRLIATNGEVYDIAEAALSGKEGKEDDS